MDCSLPGSCIHGIFQARVLEWGAKRGCYISSNEGFLLTFSYPVSTLVFLCALYLGLPLRGAPHPVWVGSSSQEAVWCRGQGQTTLRLILDCH